LLPFHLVVQAIEICEIRDIALNANGILSDLLYRGSEFMLTTTGDENLRSLRGEGLCCCQSDSAAAPCDNCDFSF
jgi:hypothetical protein